MTTLNPADFAGMYPGPGKFEGEPNATAYCYDALMHGSGDEHLFGNQVATLFTVTAREAAAFAEHDLHHGDVVAIIEDDQGFVSLLAYATHEAAEADLERTFG